MFNIIHEPSSDWHNRVF